MYEEVARCAGSSNVRRAVVNILSKNYNPEISCYRIIRSDGASGGYNKGRERNLLQKKR